MELDLLLVVVALEGRLLRTQIQMVQMAAPEEPLASPEHYYSTPVVAVAVEPLLVEKVSEGLEDRGLAAEGLETIRTTLLTDYQTLEAEVEPEAVEPPL